MSFLRSLFKKGEIVPKVTETSIHVIYPGPKAISKCITHEATITIEHAPDFKHRLHVELTNEDEIFNNSQDKDAYPTTFFLIPVSSQYPKFDEEESTLTFSGRINTGTGDSHLVGISLEMPSNPTMVRNFHRKFIAMIWSTMNASEPSACPIDEVIADLDKPLLTPPSSRITSSRATSSSAVRTPKSTPTVKTSPITTTPSVGTSSTSPIILPPLPSDSVLEGTTLKSWPVKFFKKLDDKLFHEVFPSVKCDFKIIQTSRFEFIIAVTKYDVPAVSVPLSSSLVFKHIEDDPTAFSFVAGEGGSAAVYMIQFDNEDVVDEVDKDVAELAVKNAYKKESDDIQELNWLMSGLFSRIPVSTTVDMDHELEADAHAEAEYSLGVDSEEEEEEDVGRRTKSYSTPSRNPNRGFVASIASDRNFLLRDGDIGVVALSGDGTDFSPNVMSVVPTWKGTTLTPSRAMLNNRDSSMLLLSSNGSKDSVYRLDLNRGEVVEEFKAHVDSKVRTVAPMKKNSQITDEQLFAGMTHNRTLVWDPRQGHESIRSMGYQYSASTKPELSCMATTGDGGVALGSKKGDVRLFSNLDNKRAKTLIPGWGKEILGIDTTSDGHYVLVTCSDYLMLICTKSEGGVTGFTKGMTDKPQPIKLQLSPEDVARMGGKVSFKPAKFDRNPDNERTIVTATGRWIVTFNLPAILYTRAGRKLRDGAKTYSVVSFGQEVVDDSFVGTSSHNIGAVSEEKLKLVQRTRKAM
ncbi:hypothetical protein RCL1_006109 [Eukaryota sp. TZLM3-RCL]